MREIKYNINNYVKVKITDYGREKLREHHYKILGSFSLGYTEPKTDENGYTRFQMHDLFHRLGECLINGGEMPFEPNIIIEVDNENT